MNLWLPAALLRCKHPTSSRKDEPAKSQFCQVNHAKRVPGRVTGYRSQVIEDPALSTPVCRAGRKIKELKRWVEKLKSVF